MKWKIYRRIFYNASDVNNNILLQRRRYFQLSYVYHTAHTQWNEMFAEVSEWMMAAARHLMALPLLAMGKQQIQLAANHRCGEMKLSNKRECARACLKLLCIGSSPTAERPDIYRSVHARCTMSKNRNKTERTVLCLITGVYFIFPVCPEEKNKFRCTWEKCIWVFGLAVCIFMNIKWCIECFMLYNKLHGGSGFARHCQEKCVARGCRRIVFTFMLIANCRYCAYLRIKSYQKKSSLFRFFLWFLWPRG